ncbi:MAG: hypothetical protein QM775_22765 [Pirellulales bacterium]
MSDRLAKPRYWFPAKTYGWGWGLPTVWQGWAVMLTWLAVMIGVAPWLVVRSLPAFFVFDAVMVVGLIAICYVKGEPPRWRWGDDDKRDG